MRKDRRAFTAGILEQESAWKHFGARLVKGALPLSHSPRQRPEAFGNPFFGTAMADKSAIMALFYNVIIIMAWLPWPRAAANPDPTPGAADRIPAEGV
jgi:F0F1-type ATP synthase membrane subunit c/vacuolar-type H+-ATPase subunit K